MSYSLKHALSKGSMLDRNFGRPVSREIREHKSLVLSAEELEGCYTDDAGETWVRLQALIALFGHDPLTVKTANENSDGSITLVFQ